MIVKKIRWDPHKAEINWKKHHVSFEEAETIFYDPLIDTVPDSEHSFEENRYRAIATSRFDRLLVVAYAIRDDDLWLITARRGTPAERRRYMATERIHDRHEDPIDTSDIPETDFTNAVRGLHWIPKGILRVSIDEDVARYYRDDEAVNVALRMLIAEGRAPAIRNE